MRTFGAVYCRIEPRNIINNCKFQGNDPKTANEVRIAEH